MLVVLIFTLSSVNILGQSVKGIINGYAYYDKQTDSFTETKYLNEEYKIIIQHLNNKNLPNKIRISIKGGDINTVNEYTIISDENVVHNNRALEVYYAGTFFESIIKVIYGTRSVVIYYNYNHETERFKNLFSGDITYKSNINN
jgi:hypothetical protein